jgi:hypothetical protein
LKGVRRANLVATEFGTNLLTPPTCVKDHCPATGIRHSVGETQVSDFLAHELRRAAGAKSIFGILTFAIRTTMANARSCVKSNIWKPQFSAVSNGPLQEQEQ